ncbi:extracellular solute-binding protein [Paenibacillus sp. LHD-117]|uniref:extracellular solute-binding protein n=1 Tax=Paenibacillus sp. LHD-117 TaxID=3071412 RepID=UPI0027DED348|nr:extracellular solute-binding protein [Paenibacillus sp. LHD-117]MDQ6419722.1 extracellular solute-binding protein [Paenibacillus sp. LHD-117]
MRRKFSWVLILVLIAAATMSACNGKNKVEPSSSATSEASVAPSASNSDETPAPSDGKFDPPITLTTVGTLAPTLKYAAGDDVDNNPWTREYESRYGVKIKTVWTVDESQWEQKTNLMISTGDIPDFFRASATQFKQLAEAGLLEDLTAAYESAPERAKNILTEGGANALESAKVDGKLLAIPFTGTPKEGAQMVWIRTDWLKKLSLSEPKTMDDLLNIIDAFTTKDPDGNNKNDTFGLAVDMNLSTLTGFFNGFHAYNNIWLKDADGKLQYSSVQPEMKNALQALQNMFKKKQIDPEFGSKDLGKVVETIVSSKVGVLFNSPYAGLWPLQQNIDQDPNAEWNAFPIVSVDSEPAKNQAALGTLGYWVVKKGVEHPEALFSMLDMWVELFYENKDDAINKQFINDGNTEIWQMNKIASYRAFKNADQRIKVTKALDSGDTSELTGDDKGVFDKIKSFQGGDRKLWGWNAIFGKDGSMAVTDKYRQNDQYVNDEFITSPLPIMTERSADLTKVQLETFTKIIFGAASIDEFDKFVTEWKTRGGDAVTEEVNAWYASR